MPTIGGLFWNDVSAALGSILLQMCSGRMGTHMPSMLALGLAVVNFTVGSSAASTLVIPPV